MVRPADVFFIDARASRELNLLEKFRALLDSCGLEEVVSEGDEVAVKIHYGGPENTRYLRPDYLKEIVEKVKKLRGNPFLCETAGLGYWKTHEQGSGRAQLQLAYNHGYLPEVVGAPVAIVGGMMGQDSMKIDIPNGILLKKAYVARDLAETDALIVVTHFKGHCRTGVGGALKQLGMGGMTKKGKAQAHYLNMPMVDPSLCDGCGECALICPCSAIQMIDGKAAIDPEGCECCFACIALCPKKSEEGEEKRAIVLNRPSDTEFQVRIVDQLAGLLKARGDRSAYYFNFMLEITPNCDCERFSDVPIVPDLGVLACKDPVAIDQASIDMVNAAQGMPNSRSEEVGAIAPGSNKFKAIWPNSEGGIPMLEAAENLGIETRKYRLRKIKF